MATILFGIHNCDSVKKAQHWLSQNNVPYTFHDFRKDGIDKALVTSFVENIKWTELLNKRSSSYRQLSEEQKSSLNLDTIIDLFIEYPTLIKRPLLIHNGNYQIAFKAENYKKLFSL